MPEDLRKLLDSIRDDIESISAATAGERPRSRRETFSAPVEPPAAEPESEAPSEGPIGLSDDADPAAETPVPTPRTPPPAGFEPAAAEYMVEEAPKRERSPETWPSDPEPKPAGSRIELLRDLAKVVSLGLAAAGAYQENPGLLALGLGASAGLALLAAFSSRASEGLAINSLERRMGALERRIENLKFSSGGVSQEFEEEVREVREILKSLVKSLETPGRPDAQ